MAIRRVLIANRGEIARRIARSCRAIGVEAVAVYSDADADAPHVREADLAFHLGPAPSASSYLDAERLLAAARATGADAIHPGYGFLAENAAFADAVAAAGLIFIGPPGAVIRRLGAKNAAKELARGAGVPVLPAYPLDATGAEFPVLVKAVAGGGGRGMRVVESRAALEAALASAGREAQGAFADGSLMLEKYVARPRHVEFQILAAQDGQTVHLFERDCSVQRRHQKIIEESPSPALDAELRRRMGEAAVAVARAADYRNAGTVEFLLAPDGGFYFLEVNTRLQVEHPVTELVVGIDLVREQIRVAAGEPLGYRQEDLALHGAAVEVRLCAENPSAGFLPTAGVLHDWHFPELAGVRVDAGVVSGSRVTIHYDSMLAKVIGAGATRAEAIARTRRALELASIQGIATNRELLIRLLDHPDFIAGEVNTQLLERELAAILPAAPAADAQERAAIAAALSAHQQRRRERALLPALETGFRNNRFADQEVQYRCGERDLTVRYRSAGDDRFLVAENQLQVAATDPPELAYQEASGVRRRFRVVHDGAHHYYVHDGRNAFVLVEAARFPEPERAEVAGGLVAPMPGRVARLLCSAGETVVAGAPLVILEAMKVEHTVSCPQAGRIARVCVQEGEQVNAHALLVVMEEAQ